MTAKEAGRAWAEDRWAAAIDPMARATDGAFTVDETQSQAVLRGVVPRPAFDLSVFRYPAAEAVAPEVLAAARERWRELQSGAKPGGRE